MVVSLLLFVSRIAGFMVLSSSIVALVAAVAVIPLCRHPPYDGRLPGHYLYL